MPVQHLFKYLRQNRPAAGTRPLTGRWTGLYHYPSYEMPVPFSVHFSQAGSAITGESIEPNTFIELDIEELPADWTGHCDGADVQLFKTYCDVEGADHTVIYNGKIEQGGDVILGRWSVTRFGDDNRSGFFEMRRGQWRQFWDTEVVANEP